MQEIAQGAYTEIAVSAPAEASAGDLVNVEVEVKNLYDYAFYIGVGGDYNGDSLAFSPEYAMVDPGAAHPFSASFVMPEKGLKLRIASFYWTGEEWYQDDYTEIDIALTVPPEEEEPEFSWWPLAAVAGLGVLGVGTVFVLSAASRR